MKFPLVLPPGVSGAGAGYRTCSDQTFSPFVDFRFDFALFFEQLIFSSLPSLILAVFSPWIIRCDSRRRTLELGSDSSSIIALIASNLLVKTGLLLLEILPKQSYLRLEYKQSSSESRADIIDRSFVWLLADLFSLLHRGAFKQKKII